MEPPTKSQRLQRLRSRLPFISQSALAAVLQLVSAEQLPAATTRLLREARDSFSKIQTPYGSLHQQLRVESDEGDEPIDVEYQHPFAMLHYLCSKSRTFSELILRTHSTESCSIEKPWQLILYCDEIHPGSQLAYRSERKLWEV